MKVASVLIPLPVPEAFDYEVPEALSLARGDQVAVPLGPRLIRGVVAEVFETTGSNRRLKAIDSRLDDPTLPEGVMDFVEWAGRWTRFKELAHFQYTGGLRLVDFQNGKTL